MANIMPISRNRINRALARRKKEIADPRHHEYHGWQSNKIQLNETTDIADITDIKRRELSDSNSAFLIREFRDIRG